MCLCLCVRRRWLMVGGEKEVEIEADELFAYKPAAAQKKSNGAVLRWYPLVFGKWSRSSLAWAFVMRWTSDMSLLC